MDILGRPEQFSGDAKCPNSHSSLYNGSITEESCGAENRKEKVCQIIKSGGVIKQIASVHDGQKKTFKVIIKKDPKDGGEIFRQIKSEVFIKQEIELKPETVIKEENIEESFNLPWIKQENISEHNI